MEESARISGSRGGPLRLPRRLLARRSDERLVEGLRAGDDMAFEVMYERYAAGVLGFCRHMLGSQEEAEDALQQTFVSAHRALLRDDRQISFKAWLYTIARNTSLSMLRARRERTTEMAELPSTIGLADEVERRSELRQLVLGLQDLPDDQRAALVLTEFGDLSHAEVAQVLGCEAQAVKGIVFRARSGLIERREGWEADCGEIREELAVARGGSLRRGRLRHHLAVCPGCVAYLEEIKRQRQLFAIGLPVVPALALKDSIMAATGIGTSSVAGVAGAGALATGGAAAGSSVLGGTLAKVAVVGVLVGGAGVATEATVDHRGGDPRPVAPAGIEPGSASGGRSGIAAPALDTASKDQDARARKGVAALERAQRQNARRAAARRNGVADDNRGLARGRAEDPPGLRRGQSTSPPGKPLEKGRPPASPRATPPRSQAPSSPPGGKRAKAPAEAKTIVKPKPLPPARQDPASK